MTETTKEGMLEQERLIRRPWEGGGDQQGDIDEGILTTNYCRKTYLLRKYNEVLTIR